MAPGTDSISDDRKVTWSLLVEADVRLEELRTEQTSIVASAEERVHTHYFKQIAELQAEICSLHSARDDAIAQASAAEARCIKQKSKYDDQLRQERQLWKVKMDKVVAQLNKERGDTELVVAHVKDQSKKSLDRAEKKWARKQDQTELRLRCVSIILSMLHCSYILSNMIKVKLKLDKEKSLQHDDKMKHHQQMSAEIEKRRQVEREVEELNEWIGEIAEEVRDAKHEAKKAKKSKERFSAQAEKRLLMLKDLQVKLAECMDQAS